MSRARVLVVDDKKNYLALFRRILPADIEVDCASDGTSALEKLAQSEFDVVVSDVRMPGMDGVTLLETIKTKYPNVEVVLMTAYGTIPNAVKAMKLGAVEYLTKPFDPEDAVRAVEEAVQRRLGKAPESEQPSSDLTYREAIAAGRGRATRDYIIAILRDVKGNVTQAAEKAGIERESFHRLMKRHGVKAEDYRPKGQKE